MYLTLTLHFDNGTVVIAEKIPVTGNMEVLRDLGDTPIIDESTLFALTGLSIKTTTVQLPPRVFALDWTETDIDG